MAKQDPPVPQPIPSTEVENTTFPADSIETTFLALEARASTTTTVLQEILTHGDERYYVHHWGINE